MQVNMLVAEYKVNFTCLRQFALGFVASEKLGVDRFLECLIYPIKRHLFTLVYTTMVEVVGEATCDKRIYKS